MPGKSVKQVFSIALILLLPVLAVAQLPKQKTIDSLLFLISKARTDTGKIMLLNKMAFIYHDIDIKKGIDFANQALKMARKIGYKKGIVKVYYGLGANYWAQYDFIRAQDNYGSALKIAEELGDKTLIAKSFANIGICYEAENNLPKAITYYKKALVFFSETGDKDEMAGCFSNIANIYLRQIKYESALNALQQSLQLSKETGNKRASAQYNWRIGLIYSSIRSFNMSFKYFEISLRLFQKLNDDEDMADVLVSLGDLYLKFNNYPQAILQYDDALQLSKENKGNTAKGTAATGTQADFYYAIGEAYFEWAGYNNGLPVAAKVRYIQLASKNFQNALSLAKSKGYKETIAASLKKLSDIQMIQGHFANALKTYKAYIIYRDSVNNLAKDEEYKRHELTFEYAKRADSLNYAEILQKTEMQQVKTLSANKLRQRSLYAIVIIVILSLIVSYFVFRNRLQKLSFKSQLGKEKAEAELKQALFENKLNDLTLASLKSQMNPHFIFNCLNSIKFYVEKNDTDAASLYITKFSKLIRNILDSARSEKVTLAEEVELIKLYLEMEYMRLKEKLHYTFEVAQNIDIEFIEVPPLLIQPYIENAIWHGLMNKESGGAINLSIKTTPDEKYLIIGITDDGIGRKKAAELKKKSIFQHISHGMKLNNERIEIINAKYKTNTEVVITDLSDADNNPCGTSVTIKLLIQ
jgi:tetratricopeptide (TPR) repeat protein